MPHPITVFDTEVILEEIRVAITAVGPGYTVTVTAVLTGGDTLGSLTEFVDSYEGDLLTASTDTAKALVPQLSALCGAGDQLVRVPVALVESIRSVEGDGSVPDSPLLELYALTED